MRFKLAARCILFAVLCICLMSGELWLGNALASNTGRIVFTSFRDGNFEIYVMDADGGNQENRTNHPADDRQPDWSPDGRRIAYEAHHKEFHHIYVVGADGRNRVRLTHNEEHHGRPAWTPDGRIIAYDVLDGIWPDFQGTIHLMTADGKYLKQLSDDRGARDFEPDISPLGLAVSPMSKTAAIWGRLKKNASDLR